MLHNVEARHILEKLLVIENQVALALHLTFNM